MKQTVHDFFRKCSGTSACAGSPSQPEFRLAKSFFLAAFAVLASLAGQSQTYTTKASGAWNSAATWENGSMPGTTIGSGKTVIVKHKVTFTQASDLNISGTLRIEGDTLVFPSTYDKKLIVGSSGTISVKNGGVVQTITSNKCDMEISGRLILDNAYFSISKDVKAMAGAKRTYRNSVVRIGEMYELDGTSSKRTIDTIINSQVEVAILRDNFDIKDYCDVYVANATVIVGKGKFVLHSNSTIKVLPSAAGNFGFDYLKTEDDLENKGAWDARIDAYCVNRDVKDDMTGANAIDFTRAEDCTPIMQTGELPEVAFSNAVLKSGEANKQGAVYRFAGVTTGVDAEIVLKKFSRSDIVMKNFDNQDLGWAKAFQPEFGLSGLVLPFQNWYVDFELNFYKAGTNTPQKVSKIVFTVLDLDGDGNSIAEYATFANPSRADYSPVTMLANGEIDILDPIANAGLLNTVVGPVQNFLNIDTGATQVMSTFTYLNKDKITFRYGATSSARSSNGSGVRMNSLWAKPFSLEPWRTLPVKFEKFTVVYKKGDAELAWSASTDAKLSHFLVQRSTDGVNFTSIATVFDGSSAGYSYTDKTVSSASGVLYYRVVSVGHAKETLATNVKMIRLGKENGLALTTYPNPVVNELRLTLPAAWQGKPVMVNLYAANGAIAKSMQLGSAGQTETVGVNELVKGVYIVSAVCGAESAQQRIVKN